MIPVLEQLKVFWSSFTKKSLWYSEKVVLRLRTRFVSLNDVSVWWRCMDVSLGWYKEPSSKALSLTYTTNTSPEIQGRATGYSIPEQSCKHYKHVKQQVIFFYVMLTLLKECTCIKCTWMLENKLNVMYIIRFFYRIVQLIALTFRFKLRYKQNIQTLRKEEKRVAILDIYSPFLWLRQLFVPGNRRFLDSDLPVLYDVCWHQQKQKLFLMAEFYKYPRLVWPQNDKSAIMLIKRS